MMGGDGILVGTIYGSGSRVVFRPSAFTRHEADHDAVKAEGLMIAKEGLELIDKAPRVEGLRSSTSLDRRSRALLCNLGGRSNGSTSACR